MAQCHYHASMNSIEKPQPRQSEDKYVVRFPDGMRDRLKDAAHDNGRSMNAEIVARLQQSFEPHTGMEEVGHLKGVLDSAIASIENRMKIESALYVLLDSTGYPISWAEIAEHLRALKQASGFDPANMQVQVITPDMESSSRRQAEAVALAKRLRAELGKSGPIPGGVAPKPD